MPDMGSAARRRSIRTLALGVFVAQMISLLAVVVMDSAFGWRAGLTTFVAICAGSVWGTNLTLIQHRRPRQ